MTYHLVGLHKFALNKTEMNESVTFNRFFPWQALMHPMVLWMIAAQINACRFIVWECNIFISGFFWSTWVTNFQFIRILQNHPTSMIQNKFVRTESILFKALYWILQNSEMNYTHIAHLHMCVQCFPLRDV